MPDGGRRLPTVPGGSHLQSLLAALDPWLDPTALAYVRVPPGHQVPEVRAFARVEEREGTTLVMAGEDADGRGLEVLLRCRRVELRVASDLAAVGLTAAVAGALAEAGIAANVVAAAVHDHVLVPEDRAEEALEVLRAVSASART